MTNNEIKINISENHISVEEENQTTITRIIKESFPDFNSVIPGIYLRCCCSLQTPDGHTTRTLESLWFIMAQLKFKFKEGQSFFTFLFSVARQ